MKIEQRELVYGSKTLSVSVNPDTGSATFRFGTREPRWLHRRISGETTAIFQLGEEILLQEVAASGKPVSLVFDTASSRLKLWACAHADDLHFDHVEPPDPTAYRVTVTKTYR